MTVVLQNEETLPIIPGRISASGLDVPHAHAQDLHFNESREKLFTLLRSAPGFSKAVTKLVPSGLYRLLPGPSGAWMVQDASGATQAVWRNSEGISQHGRVVSAGPNIVGALTSIASQVLLVKIAIDIQTVIRQNHQISISLHNDRVAHVAAGASMLDQAMLATTPSVRQHLLANTIQSLNEGIQRCCREMQSEIVHSPSKNQFGDNWWKSNVTKAEEHLHNAQESLQASLFGSRCLAESYAMLGESRAATHAMSSVLSLILESGVNEACTKARFLPRRGDVFPEDEWKVVRDDGRKWIAHLLKYQNAIDGGALPAVEASGRELMGSN
jgi:hypothetical protein